MEDLKRLTLIVYACTAGVVLSFGGALVTAYRHHKAYEAQIRPATEIPLPQTQ